MPRPCCVRHVGWRPNVRFFKPAGIPVRDLETVPMKLDEIEALRLADLEGLYQEQAAVRMKISRQTFARIVGSARRKVADALLHGKALRIEPGDGVSTVSTEHGEGGVPQRRARRGGQRDGR